MRKRLNDLFYAGLAAVTVEWLHAPQALHRLAELAGSTLTVMVGR